MQAHLDPTGKMSMIFLGRLLLPWERSYDCFQVRDTLEVFGINFGINNKRLILNKLFTKIAVLEGFAFSLIFYFSQNKFTQGCHSSS